MTVDLQSLKPHRLSLSHQTQRYLRNLIEAGTYQPGDQLPSQNELATELGISRATLREALLSLEQEGIVVLKHGVGYLRASWLRPPAGERAGALGEHP